MSEGAKLKRVQIFRAGTHRGKVYTESDLDDIVRNFDAHSKGNAPLLRVPGVLGHEENQEYLERSDLPAAAWCEGLSRQGKTLFADFGGIPPKVARLLSGKAYRTVSAEIYDEPPEGVQGKGKMLRRVAFLGGEIPQVKSLDDIPEPEMHSERVRPTAIRLVPGAALAVAGEPHLWTCFSEVRRYPPLPTPSRERHSLPRTQTLRKHAEGKPMDRDAMVAELAKRGISEEIAKGCGDEQLAEWLRSLDSGSQVPADETPPPAEETPAEEPPAPEEPPADGQEDEEEFDDEAPPVAGDEEMAEGDDAETPPVDDQPGAAMAEDGQPVDIDVKKMAARAKAYGEAQAKKMMDKYCGEPGKSQLAEGEDVSAVTKQPKPAEKMSEKRLKVLIREEAKKLLKEETSTSIGELQKFREETIQGAKKDGVDAVIETAKKEGRLPPAVADHFHRLLMKADARAVLEKFKEKDGKVKEMTEFDQIVRDIGKMPTLFKEHVKGRGTSDGGATAGDDAEVAQIEQHFESFKEDFPKTSTKEQLVAGFKAARKHDPKLTAEKYLAG